MADGIIVTHEKYAGLMGGGVYVEVDGRLIMYSGEISANHVIDWGGPFPSYGATGGGVYNLGVFEMYGGKISGNSATCAGTHDSGAGGGVYNKGTFKMSGGEITRNNAYMYGGGVNNAGVFTMSGGEITNNMSQFSYGVHTGGDASFEWLGGTISGNTDYHGRHEDEGSSEDNNNGVSSGGNSGSGSDDASSGQSNDNGGHIGDNNGSSNDNNLMSNDNNFSLREVVIICIGVIGVTVGVVMTVLFFTSKKKLDPIEEKM